MAVVTSWPVDIGHLREPPEENERRRSRRTRSAQSNLEQLIDNISSACYRTIRNIPRSVSVRYEFDGPYNN